VELHVPAEGVGDEGNDGVGRGRAIVVAAGFGGSRARAVTSRPSAIGRRAPFAAAPAQASKQTFAASGSHWMFHSVVGAVLPALR
jgi:hypothetical protein